MTRPEGEQDRRPDERPLAQDEQALPGPATPRRRGEGATVESEEEAANKDATERPHEAWSTAGQADNWGRQQARWNHPSEGTSRGQGNWQTRAPESFYGDAQWGEPREDGDGEPVEPRSAGAERVVASGGDHGPGTEPPSDVSLLHDVARQLGDGGVDARDITVTVVAGEVTLEGTVPSDEMKRLATERLEGSEGIATVRNNLRVAARG